MIHCSNCGASMLEDLKICLTCGFDPKSDDTMVKDRFRFELVFESSESLPKQIRDYFFKTLKYRVETELDPRAYRQYFDHFHSTGFYKNFDLRVGELAEEVEILHATAIENHSEIDQLMHQSLNAIVDYFVIVFCEPLHKMKLPEAILRYEKTAKESLDLGAMILDYLGFENEDDKVYTDFFKMPVAKLKHANEAFLFAEKSEKLFFICDQTIFGSCKEGFAMTDKALYWKAHFNEPAKVCYSALEAVKRDGEWITINGQFFNVNKTLNYKMQLLLRRIGRRA